MRGNCVIEIRNRHLLHDLDAEAFQRDNLARVIGQQADGVEAEVGENLRSQAYFPVRFTLAFWQRRETTIAMEG